MPAITLNLPGEGFQAPPIYFYTASACFSQNSICYPEGRQRFYQILLVLSGKGTLFCQGGEYPLRPGCAFFTAHGQPSSYRDDGGLTTAFLTARGDGIPALLNHYGCGSFLFARQVNLKKHLCAIEAIIQEYYHRKREGLLSALTYSFFVDFLEEQTSAPPTPLERISLHIERHFSQKLTLQTLAEVGNMSVSKLCHDFKKHMGCTVFQHILNLRLTYARSYLRANGDIQVREAALACGFEDISYFCKAYKKKFGATPSAGRGSAQ